ncbi:MAG: sulfotransferase [Candidatus Electrothrix sp. GW3-4]|uniref:sulfotransferase family protein n=1 Tax=Candidatus Electrothrix sp. GW3-4 TaxID=3126740 RepID=UPI0030CE2895
MKVNLFSIGAMRAGSTSIYHFLDQHPEIYMSPIKEPYYFHAEFCRRRLVNENDLSTEEYKCLTASINSGKYRTAEAYQSLFNKVEEHQYVGEASHYLHHPATAQLIHEYNPNSKIIICLRNPIERIYSEYMLYVRDSKVSITFDNFISKAIVWNKEKNIWNAAPISRLNKGFYSKQIIPWIEFFGVENVKIFLFEDMVGDPAEFCRKLYSWLGVDMAFQPVPIHAQASGKPISSKIMKGLNTDNFVKRNLKRIMPHSTRIKLRYYAYKFFLKREKMSNEVSIILHDIYKDEIDRLEEMISRDLSAWKKTRLC